MSLRFCRVTARGCGALRQGEILSDVGRFRLDPLTLTEQQPSFQLVSCPYAIVLTQDCDLDWDFNARVPDGKPEKLLPEVLLCKLPRAEEIKNQTKDLGSKGWERIRQNNDPRYHFLQMVDAGCDANQFGLPELTADFKHYFTIPTAELYRRIELGLTHRRCVFVSPYMEHFATRFAAYLSRIGLPEQHSSV